MSEDGERDAALRTVRARRFSTDGETATSAEEAVGVALETALTIDVERVESYTLLCTPNDREALVAGFLLSEGLIDGMDDVAVLRPCDDDPAVVRVRLRREVPRIGDPGRNLLISSSCGACGTEDIETRIRSLPRVGDDLRVEAGALRSASQHLCDRQSLFEACGGTHAAGIFDREGRILACAEDTGRHNALDKAIGECLLAGTSIAGRGAILSGRVSLEMVGKCARAGIELVAAVSAPTSLAIDVAERCNITLCAFVRETRATVFTHPRRVGV